MRKPVSRRRTRLLLGASWLILILPGAIPAQTAAAPAFDVATIKPTDPNSSRRSLMLSGEKFETEGQTLKSLIVFAYGLNAGTEQQVSGGPAWVGSAMFDIDAKQDAETFAKLKILAPEMRMEQVRLMLRQLLEERFKLKIHHETKELPVYALTVVKSGSKLTPSAGLPPTPATDKPAAGAGPPDANRKLPPGWNGIRLMGRGQMEGKRATTAMLSSVFDSQPEIGGRLILDKTGLTGKYDFTLKWTPDAGIATGDAGAPADPSVPGLFTAMQEQLGLKLDATKGPVDTIVIDSAEKPSEN